MGGGRVAQGTKGLPMTFLYNFFMHRTYPLPATARLLCSQRLLLHRGGGVPAASMVFGNMKKYVRWL
jgi:hypothetical protein